MAEIERLQAENLKKVEEEGPGLRYGQNTWIVKRAPGWVLTGGLGAMGLGQMWIREDEKDKDKPGYDEAPWQDEVPKGSWG